MKGVALWIECSEMGRVLYFTSILDSVVYVEFEFFFSLGMFLREPERMSS